MTQDLEQWETTEIVICGGGPTGALLSAILGSLRVSNVVLEREAEITTDPRGIALDEDGIRLLQSIGVYDKIYTEIGACMGKFNFIGGTHSDLNTTPFMTMDYSTTEGGTGHVGCICHKQPVLEKTIRDVIDKDSFCELRSNATIAAITEGNEMVSVEYEDVAGRRRGIRARFMVGADGKTGFTRKCYLEPKGILMERCSETSYEETWVALNWQITLPTQQTHPDFPLWKLGHSPQDVYDLFFPSEFRFLCNPQRPAVCGRFGRPADRLWRFEFVVKATEDGAVMAGPESLRKIVFPYITHPGKRYGLRDAVQYPEDCIKTLRSRPFAFSARSCNKWSLGRVILIGDAAHVFPPFGGQGIASGFRDSSSLAWRLAVLCHEPLAIDHETFLAAWYTERKQQLEKSLAMTITNGAFVTEGNPFKVFTRDWYLWTVQLVPSWRRELEKGPRSWGMTRYKYQAGMPFLPNLGGGVCLPQVYCRALGNGQGAGEVRFTDDVIFAPAKRGLFQIVALVDSFDEIFPAAGALTGLSKLSSGYVSDGEATFIIQATHSVETTLEIGQNSVVRIATGAEFAADAMLCKNRPAPKYYDAHRMRHDLRGKTFIVVRPDRFVFAACANVDELRKVVGQIRSAMHLKSSLRPGEQYTGAPIGPRL